MYNKDEVCLLGIDAEAAWEIIKKELPILELRIKEILTQ